MNPSTLELLANLILLLALLLGFAAWWRIKLGSTRGKIVHRLRDITQNHHATALAGDQRVQPAVFRVRFLRQLARIGNQIPMFDDRHRRLLQQEMLKGGYRSSLAVPILITVKFSTGLALTVMAMLFGAHLPKIGHFSNTSGILMPFMFMVGMIVPEYVFKVRCVRRRRIIAQALPDALDLLVICTNAGNSLVVSIRRVADELAAICPPLASELTLTADELKLSGDNARALTGLAERIDLPSIRALISTLIQATRYGTPIAHALRTLSRTERQAHLVALEEKAAKLAPKMALPMMLFILPAIIAIAIGPAMIQLLGFAKQQ
jgi:tight adherence protein C